MSTTARNKHGQAARVLPQGNDSHRLPCRGCTRDCSNYPHCNGKPWRMQAGFAADGADRTNNLQYAQ
ncbi:MAG: hypothetical protein WBN81_10545 [Gammaproteobacteria bacterium]